MRIVFLSQAIDLGGAERSLLDLVGSLLAMDPSLDLRVITGGEGPLAAAARDAGARVVTVPVPPGLAAAGDSAVRFGAGPASRVAMLARAARAIPAAWQWTSGVRRVVRDAAPDIVHSNDNKSHLVASRMRGPRVVWHVRDFIGRRPLMSAAMRHAAPRVAGAIAISEAVGLDAGRVLAPLPVAVVLNGIDVDQFSPGEARGAWLDGLAAARPPARPGVRIGLVAAYARWKGHMLFLEAAARCRARAAGVAMRFYIVGGPIYRTSGSQFSEEELRRESARLGIEADVSLVPFQRDIVSVYRSLDVVVHASTEPEPFGRTIAEGMACGRAVVASGAGGASELFHHGEDALAFPPGDAGALSEALCRLVEDPALRERLGGRARETARRRFSRSRLGPEVLAAYVRFGIPARPAATGLVPSP